MNVCYVLINMLHVQHHMCIKQIGIHSLEPSVKLASVPASVMFVLR